MILDDEVIYKVERYNRNISPDWFEDFRSSGLAVAIAYYDRCSSDYPARIVKVHITKERLDINVDD